MPSREHWTTCRSQQHFTESPTCRTCPLLLKDPPPTLWEPSSVFQTKKNPLATCWTVHPVPTASVTLVRCDVTTLFKSSFLRRLSLCSLSHSLGEKYFGQSEVRYQSVFLLEAKVCVVTMAGRHPTTKNTKVWLLMCIMNQLLKEIIIVLLYHMAERKLLTIRPEFSKNIEERNICKTLKHHIWLFVF